MCHNIRPTRNIVVLRHIKFWAFQWTPHAYKGGMGGRDPGTDFKYSRRAVAGDKKIRSFGSRLEFLSGLRLGRNCVAFKE
jgi:hypothetical protein